MLPEERVGDGDAVVAGCAVVEEEAHGEVCGCGEGGGGGGGEEFECECGGVVWYLDEYGVSDFSLGDHWCSFRLQNITYPEEVWVRLCQVCQAEEGLHAAIGTKLDVERGFAGAGHCDVEGFDDLSSDGCTGDSADRVRCTGNRVSLGVYSSGHGIRGTGAGRELPIDPYGPAEGLDEGGRLVLLRKYVLVGEVELVGVCQGAQLKECIVGHQV